MKNIPLLFAVRLFLTDFPTPKNTFSAQRVSTTFRCESLVSRALRDGHKLPFPNILKQIAATAICTRAQTQLAIKVCAEKLSPRGPRAAAKILLHRLSANLALLPGP
jgi:hypothetical protein